MINIYMYILGYLLGAVPFGLILARVFGGVDITKSGSGSIGATNVLRVLKQSNPRLAKRLSIATMLCDGLKGVLAIAIAKFAFNCDESVLWTVGVLAVVGHCFSPFLFFNGGKGVATGCGVLACFLPLETAIALAVWFVVGKVLKISSLASLAGLFTLIITSFIFHYDLEPINTHAPIFIICFIVLYKHWGNILRLFLGKESKVI